MKKSMKKVLCLLAVLVVLLGTTATSFGASVTYKNDADKFVFEPGGDKSVTDLFTDFKGVFPGDTLEQTVTVKNEEGPDYKVEIFMRAVTPMDLVKGEDGDTDLSVEKSQAFLSQMNLEVTQVFGDTDSRQLSDAAADQAGGLTEWTSLGIFDSGAECDLVVALTVPLDMGDEFQNAIGALDWEFKAQAYEIEEESTEDSTDPKEEAPVGDDENKDDGAQTGDDSNMMLPLTVMAVAALVLLAVLFGKRRKQSQ